MSKTEPKVIRVVIADDHPIVRSGIHNELASQTDIQVVGEAVNGEQALQLANILRPDILLLDINMPGLRAIDVMKRLRELPVVPQVIVLTVLEDEEHMISPNVQHFLVRPPTGRLSRVVGDRVED